MGFFDRFTAKKPQPARPEAAPVSSAAPAPEPAPTSASTPPMPAVKTRLVAAREKLEAKDLPGALAIYEEVLVSSGDRADVLVAVSGDLGSHGHVSEIIELVAPRYDAERHGPATGLNLLQAYLAVRNADSAQHVLDILFALNRPELEDRLHGFSNAIAEILASPNQVVPQPLGAAPSNEPPKVALVSISKPIWFYGLESMAAQLLPPKEGKLRRIAFAQLALPGYKDVAESMKAPEDELGRLSRAIPLWFAETFFFAKHYLPIAAVGVLKPSQGDSIPVLFGAEWTTENFRQLVETSGDGIDYIVSGALRMNAGDYEIVLRVWEVKNFRERKTFSTRWTPATADTALLQLQAQLRTYMEWAPAGVALPYSDPAQPRAWIETLGAALGLFLVEKSVLPAVVLRPAAADLQQAAQHASASETASLAYLTMAARAVRLGLAEPTGDIPLASNPLVTAAQSAVRG